MKISYSALSTYQTCPLQYRFQYLDKMPTAPSPSLSFGQSVHEALRWFYDVPTIDPHSLEELIDYLEECWTSEGYASPEEESRYFLQAKSAMELFHRNVGGFQLPAALEHRFRVDVGFCSLSGVIDRLDKDLDGGFEIIDYKTNRRLPPAARLEKDLQLPIYHVAVENIWGVSPEKVTFYYVLLNHRYSMNMTPERIQQALDEIRVITECIEREEFEPRKSPLCPWCDFIDACPLWEGKPRLGKKTKTPPLEIGEAVDELLATEQKLSRAIDRMEGLKRIIACYLNDHGVDRVGGSSGFASIDEDGNLTWGKNE